MNDRNAVLYAQFKALIDSMPDLLLTGRGAPDSDMLLWVGRAVAAVERLGFQADKAAIAIASDNLDGLVRQANGVKIASIVYRSLARLESSAPVGAQGAFLPVASKFDVTAAMSKIFAEASKIVMLIDPYMDHTVLVEHAPLVAEGVALRLMSDANQCKPGLSPAVKSWIAQYGALRPLEARLAPSRSLHDRLIVIDESRVWLLSQSFNAFAARSPATIVRVPTAEMETLKLEAYADIWNASAPL